MKKLSLSILFLCFSLRSATPTVDYLIRNALIYDGMGSTPVKGDIAIEKDLILEIKPHSNLTAKTVIDAEGLSVAPGFIDLHTHSDTSDSDTATRIPLLETGTKSNLNYLTQGVTTVVTGNCGAGPIYVGDFLRKLEAAKTGTNVAHLIPHGDLREKIMGNVNRAPNQKELDIMKSLVAQGMQEGAWGLSTGLYYTPGNYAKTDELIALAKVVGSFGGIYASHMRSEGTGLLEAVNETIAISKEGKLPAHISHFKADEPGSWNKMGRAIDLVKNARSHGLTITADQYPYTAASTSLSAEVIPVKLREGTEADLVKRLTDVSTHAKVIREIEQMLTYYEGGKTIQLASYPARPEWQGKDLVTLAKKEKKTIPELIIEIESHGGAKVVDFCMSEKNVQLVMKQPFVATASDGSARIPDGTVPHPRSYGTFPRKIGRYAIKRHIISLEQAIYSSTSLPAHILGLPKRGELHPGYYADLVLFDPKTFEDLATYEKPHQYSKGVAYLFVNGTLAIDHSKYTGALSGKVLRHGVEEKKLP